MGFASVWSGAVASNLPTISSQDTDTAKFCHGSDKGSLESSRVGCKQVHGGLGTIIGEQSLIRGEQPFSLLKTLVVIIVESVWSCRVHINGDSGIDSRRTHLSELKSIS